MNDLTRLEERVRSAGGLPVFNQSLQEALALIRAEAPMAEIAFAVEKDPGIAGRILKLANSAYYGMSREVATLKMALVLLGSRSVRNLMLSIGLVEILDEAASAGGYPGPGFRAHCVTTGRLAILLSRIHGLQFQSEEFVTGLVHDVGKLVLVQAFRAEAVQASDELGSSTGVELLEAEQRTFGVTHPEAGAWAAKSWSLPTAIVEAIRQHHNPPRITRLPDPSDDESDAIDTLAAVTHGANQLAHWLPAVLSNPEAERPGEWATHPVLSHPDLTAEAILEENASNPELV